MLLVEYNEKIRVIRKPDNYQDFKKKVRELLTISKFKGDPLGGLQATENSGSGWGDFFDKADIKHLIKIDVDRTFQDRDLFCENSIKEIENNVLYLFAKGNQPTSYKQGKRPFE